MLFPSLFPSLTMFFLFLYFRLSLGTGMLKKGGGKERKEQKKKGGEREIIKGGRDSIPD